MNVYALNTVGYKKGWVKKDFFLLFDYHLLISIDIIYYGHSRPNICFKLCVWVKDKFIFL